MAKITLENGMVLEGTPEELVELAKGFDEEGKPVSEEIEVGDYVKVIDADYRMMRGFKNGDIAEVLFNHHGKTDKDYRLKKVNTGTLGYVPKAGGYVVRANEKEVTAIKEEIEAEEVQRKLEAKWSKIGRKANEYKKGDIVRIVDNGSSKLKVGDIGTVSFADTDDTLTVDTREVKTQNWVGVSKIELITPVEARFDR